MEEWRYIKNYPNYMVSNLGRVKNIQTKKILKASLQSKGYLSVNLYKRNIGYNKTIHRLVAEAFLPNPDNLPQVNHKDECKTNNFAGTTDNDFTDGNLEWCDNKYNSNFGTRNLRLSTTKINQKKGKPILQYTLDGEFVKEWSSATEAANYLGCDKGHICKCCNKIPHYKTHKGFVWKYK